VLLGSICLVTALIFAQAEMIFTIEYGGKKYEFRISDADLQKTPDWPPSQEQPPLSPRRAMDIASNYLATLLPNGKDWRLDRISLKPIGDRWIYMVEFLEPLRRDGGDQLSSGFQVIVLMNGVAVIPRD
jgi:hypothetical protein